MATEDVISTAADLAKFCDFLRACPVFGFDTEFIGEETYVPDLCLLQVATPQRLALIDPLTAGSLDAFWSIVVDPAHTVIVHAGREEVRLCQRSSGRLPGNLIDLQIAAGLAGLAYPLSYGSLILQVLDVKVSKGETLTDWKKRPLTERQIHYAFDDVRYLLPLWSKLQDKLAHRGRFEWVREECATLMRRSSAEGPELERWRRLSGIGGLDRKRLALVRSLFAWREQKATRQNRPVRSVLRDDLIIEIARRGPKTEHDLEVMRGVAKRDVKEILQAVMQARASPPELWPEPLPREDDPPQLGTIANILGAVLADLCARQHIAANLVANNNDVKQLIRCAQRGTSLPASNPLASGWRATAILPELTAVLHGQRTIRISHLSRQAALEVREHPGAN